MPKALTASLPTFDSKSEKFEFTEIQRINYFHSLLKSEALQAFRNLGDTKKSQSRRHHDNLQLNGTPLN